MNKAVCKSCKSQRIKMFLKGDRCLSGKCPLDKVVKGKGVRGAQRRRPSKISEYGLQLKEKQKAKKMAGIREKQFHNYYKNATRKKGQTGEVLLQMLECRLDNIILQLGLSSSKRQARQLIVHRHVRVNEHIVDRPSCQVKAGDKITLSKKAMETALIKGLMEKSKQKSAIPGFLQLDSAKIEGVMIKLPSRDEISIPVEEQLIVELYSK